MEFKFTTEKLGVKTEILTLASTGKAEALATERAVKAGRAVRLHRKSEGGDQWNLVAIAQSNGGLRRFAY